MTSLTSRTAKNKDIITDSVRDLQGFEAYKKMMKRGYFFTGNTTRTTFWNALFYAVAIWIAFLLIIWSTEHASVHKAWRAPLGTIFTVYNLILFSPLMALVSRRFRDVGVSGKYTLILATSCVLIGATRVLSTPFPSWFVTSVTIVFLLSVIAVVLVGMLPSKIITNPRMIEDDYDAPEQYDRTDHCDKAKGFDAFKMMFVRGFQPDGKTSRVCYWNAWLFTFAFFAVLWVLAWAATYAPVHQNLAEPLSFLWFAYVSIIAIPLLTMTMRRLRDVGLDGLMVFLPGIGLLMIIIGGFLPTRLSDLTELSGLMITYGLGALIVGMLVLKADVLYIKRESRPEEYGAAVGFSAYKTMITKAMDYNNKTMKTEYMQVLIFHVGFLIVFGMVYPFVRYLPDFQPFEIVWQILFVIYGALFLVTMTSMTIRRLRDITLPWIIGVIPTMMTVLTIIVWMLSLGSEQLQVNLGAVSLTLWVLVVGLCSLSKDWFKLIRSP